MARSRKPFKAVSHVAEMIKITASQTPNLCTKVAKIRLREKSNMQGCLGEQGGRKREMKMGWKRKSLGNGEKREQNKFSMYKRVAG